MTKEGILKTIEDLYNNKKARNFFNHLVRAYFPNEKVEPVFVKPKGDFKCVLCNDALSSVNQVLDGFEDSSMKDNLFGYIHNMLNDDIEIDEKLKELIGSKVIAIQGEKTNTFMCASAYKIFESWLTGKLNSGDKHIGWLLKDFKKNKPNKKRNMDTKKETPKPKKENYGGRATFALGDLDSLQKIKDKLDNKN
jgi:protein-arginine kinase activator protein McsA